MIFDLPRSVEFGGRTWPINTDYRDVLRVLTAMEDPDVTDEEKAYICLHNLYPGAKDIPQDQLQAAFDAALDFIDRGQQDDKPGPRTMDWTQDAPLIFPAVNRAAGMEVRSVEYMHWWTFLGFFMEIKDSTYSAILGLRDKKARGKKLEKEEKEFWQRNKKICVIRTKMTEAEKAEVERLNKLLG